MFLLSFILLSSSSFSSSGVLLTNPRFTLAPTLSLPRVASRLPFTYTGADFYALCSDAMLKAVTRQASLVDAKIAQINQSPPSGHTISTAYFFDHYATKEDTNVLVEESDFEEARRELVPSVSVKELDHYRRVRSMFEQGDEEGKESQAGEVVDGKKTESGTPEWQQATSGGGHRGRSNGKGKERVITGKGKTKGKAIGSWDEDDDEEFYSVRQEGNRIVNGSGVTGQKLVFRDKGKAKVSDGGSGGVGGDRMGFQEGTVDDDEGLY